MKRLRRGAAFALALLQAAPLAAQEKRGGVVTTVEVEILSLDVLALDKKDRPVLGLTQADFEVKVAGKVQPFEFFEAPRGPSRRGGADSPEHLVGTTEPVKRDGMPMAHVLFYVDLEQLPKTVIRDTPSAIREAVEYAAGSWRLGLVANFGGAATLAWDTTFLEGVLPEIEALSASATEESSSAFARPGQRSIYDVAPPSYENRRFVEDTLIQDLVQAELAGVPDLTPYYQAIASYLASETRRVKRTVEDLKTIATRFASLEGARHLVLVSQGIERVPGLNFVTRLQNARATSKNPLKAGPAPPMLDQGPKVESNRLGFMSMPLLDLDELRTWLAASGVTFHFLDPTPLGGDQPSAEDRYGSYVGQRNNERRSLEDSAVRLVEVTGGLSRLAPGDLKGSFDTFLDAASSTYRIGVRLTDVDTRKTYKVSVSMKKPGVTALARSAYRPKGKAAAATVASVLAADAAGARLKAAVDQKKPGAIRLAKPAIPITALWKGKATMASKDPGKSFYRLEVSIPYDELKFNPEEDSMLASVRIAVEAKGLEGPFSETFTDDLFLAFTGPEYKDARGTKAVKNVTLFLPPGKYELNVTVPRRKPL